MKEDRTRVGAENGMQSEQNRKWVESGRFADGQGMGERERDRGEPPGADVLVERNKIERPAHKQETRAGGDRDIDSEVQQQAVTWQMQKDPTERRQGRLTRAAPAHLLPSSRQVIDFGSASIFSEVRYVKEPYIQSRFYRAPEILLGLPFCEKVDVWSLGCVMAELHLGWPLYPGNNEYDQVRYICETQGLPKPHLLHAARKAHHFFKRNPHPDAANPWQLKSSADYLAETKVGRAGGDEGSQCGGGLLHPEGKKI